MKHSEFIQLQARADAIGLMTAIVQSGRGNYRHKINRVLRPVHTGTHIPAVAIRRYTRHIYRVKETMYRRRYQVVINGENIGRPYCRRISAKLLIIKHYEEKLKNSNT